MIRIEPLNTSGIEGYLILRKELATETDFMLFEPSEITVGEEAWRNVAQIILDTNTQIFLAYENDTPVGFSFIRKETASRAKHRALFVIGVLMRGQGKDISVSLANAAIAWARYNNVSKIELTVMSHNIRGIRFYEKLGFLEEGIRKQSLVIKNRIADEIYMGLILN